jgi:hypothetical protein
MLKMRILEGIDSEAQIYGFISELFSILNKRT